MLPLVIDFCLFDLILYVPSTIFQLNRDESSWVEPVLSYLVIDIAFGNFRRLSCYFTDCVFDMQ